MTPPDPPPHALLLEARDAGRRVPGDPPGDGSGGAVAGGAAPSGGRWVWRHLALALAADEVLAVQGPTGAGKSLLLRALAGLDALDEGAVLLLGRPAEDWDVTRYRSTVAYLHQAPALFPGRVEENLREPFGYAVHEGLAYDGGRVLRMLEPLGRGRGFLDREVDGLSGGERQIVALVRAMLPGPHVLLLDEPTAALDPDATATVESLVRRWLGDRPDPGGTAGGTGTPDAGTEDRGVLWVTHDEAQARRVADRRVRLAEGRLVAA